jgi:hypothetical protein
MEGLPTRKKDTPHGRNDKEEEGHHTWKECQLGKKTLHMEGNANKEKGHPT